MQGNRLRRASDICQWTRSPHPHSLLKDPWGDRNHAYVMNTLCVGLVLMLIMLGREAQPNQQFSISGEPVSLQSSISGAADVDPSNGRIFYPNVTAPWETDYVPVDLLADVLSLSNWIIYNYISSKDLFELAKNTDETRNMPSILIINHLSLTEAEQFVELFRPKILIKLSDEFGLDKD